MTTVFVTQIHDQSPYFYKLVNYTKLSLLNWPSRMRINLWIKFCLTRKRSPNFQIQRNFAFSNS